MSRNFGFRHFRIVFERQRRDGLATLAAPANAGETHDGADIGTSLGERRYLLRDVEIGFLNTDGHGSGHAIIAILIKKGLYFVEHDLHANASRLSPGKTGPHFSGSCSNRRSSAGKRQSRGHPRSSYPI